MENGGYPSNKKREMEIRRERWSISIELKLYQLMSLKRNEWSYNYESTAEELYEYEFELYEYATAEELYEYQLYQYEYATAPEIY